MSFTLFGVSFEISYIFASCIVLFIANDKTGMLIPMFLSVLCHEMGHVLTLFSFGCSIKKVNLLVGRVGIEYVCSVPFCKNIIALAAGPALNIILAFIAYAVGNKVWFGINFILAFYNLLPIRGLDGGAIILEILSRFLSLKTANLCLTVISLILGGITLLTMVMFGGFEVGNASLLLFIIYLILPLVLKKLG